MVGTILGGIGLFLLGMALLTDGLQAAAGDKLREALRRYTRSRLSSVLTGAVGTAVVQSSSATTLITIGFVGAGLLSLSAAIGVVFGANVGTTLTAWIIATVGLKVKVSAFALPLVGLGALARLFLRDWRASLGTAVAGFGLVFVGIDVLQTGMQQASSMFDPGRYAGQGAGSVLLLVGLGMVMTVVMQSSSAAVATTLAAVDAGTISLIQAGALVIGQNVGTTVTAGIGALGGGAAVKRTALAHLTFNLGTGAVALALLPVVFQLAGDDIIHREPAIVIAAFHTAFNVLGVVLFVPFIDPLARGLTRWVPERGAELTRRLDVGRGATAGAIREACRLTAHAIAAQALALTERILAGERVDRELEAIDQALDRCRQKLGEVTADPTTPSEYKRHLATLHALDHLYRLEEALGERQHRPVVKRHAAPRELAAIFREALPALAAWQREGGPEPDAEVLSKRIADLRRAERPLALARTAEGALDAEEAERMLEAMRWIDRLAYHAWRAQHHLVHADDAHAAEIPPAPETQGRRGDESHQLES
jgi:phosphate:Na+ symporter